jgi:hypothetical protein
MAGQVGGLGCFNQWSPRNRGGSGKQITDRPVGRSMASRKEGYSQAAAAARSGLSERSGRRVGVDSMLPSQRDRTRRYRTRQDPFAEVWREELVPMLQAMPNMRATTLLEDCSGNHPGDFPDRLLRWLRFEYGALVPT